MSIKSAYKSFYQLNNGTFIPKIGLGVYLTPPNVSSNIVHDALTVGYRHFDSAQLYKNELETATGIHEWLLSDPVNNKREDVFFTTKIWDTDHGYLETKASIERSLELVESKIGYIDLFLMHSPNSNYEKRHGSWMALQEAVGTGKVKSIGVSNYGIKHIEELLAYPDLTIKPVVNQLEVHPWLMRTELCEYCMKNDILIEAYSPLVKGLKFGDADLLKVAQKYGKSPSQILLAWSLSKGYIILPKSVHKDRMLMNLDFDGIELTAEDLETLEKPNDYEITGWDPTVYPLDNEK